jgi:hypothetical protein
VDPLKVLVLGFAPVLDTATGLHCDIVIKAGTSYMPFIQLGLTRFQPHAVQELRLSRPTSETVQLLPERHGAVDFPDTRTLVFSLHGPIYSAVNATLLPAMPVLDLRLMVAVAPEGFSNGQPLLRWQPCLDDSGRAVETIDLQPEIIDGIGVWKCTIKLPRSRRYVHYGLLIEEFEAMMADELGKPASDGTPTFAEKPARRGPTFGHLIDFWSSASATARLDIVNAGHRSSRAESELRATP